MHISYQHTIWEFIRGDLPVADFENWLYTNSGLEHVFGEDFYLEVISANFKNNNDIYILKARLGEFLRQKFPLDCECITLPDMAITYMGDEHEEHIWKSLEKVKVYGEPRWWLALYQCKKCVQYWLIAQESQQNDIHCYRRIEEAEAEKIIHNKKWPKHFGTLEELLIIGRVNNQSGKFINFLAPSLVHFIEELRWNRPGRGIGEIAILLNIDENTLLRLLEQEPKHRA